MKINAMIASKEAACLKRGESSLSISLVVNEELNVCHESGQNMQIQA